VSERDVPGVQVCAVQARSAAAAGAIIRIHTASLSAAAAAAQGLQETRCCRRQGATASQPQNRQLPLLVISLF